MSSSHKDAMVSDKPSAAPHINEKPQCRLSLCVFALMHIVPQMELCHGAHAAADSVSAVFQQ